MIEGATLVVNATTRGLDGREPLELDWPRRSPGVALDMVYRPLETAFLAGARAPGWRSVDGLEMLIVQARPSFHAFFDVEPRGLDVRAVCLAALDASARGA